MSLVGLLLFLVGQLILPVSLLILCTLYNGPVTVFDMFILSSLSLLLYLGGLCHFGWVCSISGESVLFLVGLFYFCWVSVAISGGFVALFGESVYVIYLFCNEFHLFPMSLCIVYSSGGSVFFSVGQFSF